MDSLPPLNSLRAFEAAARHLSFNAAAAELHVTPSAISHAVKSLEADLETDLFRRQSRGVRLTPEGQIFLAPVREALQQLRQAALALRRSKEVRPLTVSAAPSLTIGWLMPRLGKFQLQYPDIEVRLSASPELVELQRSDIDVAIRSGDGRWPGLTSHFLMHEELVALCSPALCEGSIKIRRPKDLAHVTLIQDLPRLGQWRSWFNALGVHHREPERGPKFETTALAIEAAISGLGVALANKSFVETHLASRRLVIPFDVETSGRYDYYLVYPSENADVARITAFRDWLLGEVS